MFEGRSGDWQFEWRDSWDEVWDSAFVARWQELLRASSDAVVYHDPRLVRAWTETHGMAIQASPMFGLATDRSGHTVLVTWCVVSQHGRVAARRTLVHAGDGFFGYHDPLVAGGTAAAIDWASFWTAARETAGDVADQALFRFVHAQCAAGSFASDEGELSPVLDLRNRSSLDDVLARCSAKHRGDVKRQRKRLEAAGPVTFAVDTGATSEAIVDFHDRFVPTYRSKWRARREGCMLDRPGVAEFVSRVVEEGVAEGWAYYARLSVGGEPVAWHLGLAYHREIYWWIPVHDARWQAYSPGKVLLASAVERAVADGVSRLHFLTGAHMYKEQWRPDVVRLRTLRWHAPSVRGSAMSWYDASRRLMSRS